MARGGLLAALYLTSVIYAIEVCAWTRGRATFYGADGYSIHTGSCGFGFQWPGIGTGFDVAAMTDAAPDFTDSCGRCYEVQCDPTPRLLDGFGDLLDRSHVCLDEAASVIVRVTDSCPCRYPDNAYSNQKWCCFDHGITHFDLSVWAFEKLANTTWGVMGIRYREVPCRAEAKKKALPCPHPTPVDLPPSGQTPPNNSVVFERRDDWAGKLQGALKMVPDGLLRKQDGELLTFDQTFQGGRGNQSSLLDFFRNFRVAMDPEEMASKMAELGGQAVPKAALPQKEDVPTAAAQGLPFLPTSRQELVDSVTNFLRGRGQG
ncbi:hypothetical protein ACKKBF_B37940 [Auxenochlorella protothecoides x Auxenochlorella symbiontica]